MNLHPITSTFRKLLSAFVAASLLLALSVACGGDPTPEPTPEDIDAIIAEAVAAALAEAESGATSTPDPGPTPALDERDAAIAAAVAEAVAAALADREAASTPTPSPVPGAASTPTPAPASTPTAEQQAEMDRINAAAAALDAALDIALDEFYNGRLRGDLEGAIAHAVSVTGADPDAVAFAMSEILSGMPTPVPVDPTAKDMSDALVEAVTLALEFIISNPLDIPGAVAHAVSTTGVDANALTAALNRVLNNPTGFPNINTQTAVDASNAIAEHSALAAAKAAAEAEEAKRQAAADKAANPTPEYTPPPPQNYESWNDHEWLTDPKPWWRDSNPYDCDPPPNPDSPWTAAGMLDLGGQDPLSLIRYFNNGSYVRYGLMGFEGCAFMSKHPERTHLDIPADPTYFSLGNLEIAVDIARVPVGAPDWYNDNGVRVEMSMDEAVAALNDNVAAYFRKISGGRLQMTFVAGHDFQASGAATPQEVEDQWLGLIGIVGCYPDDPNKPGCKAGMPGALNRLFLNDVQVFSSGSAWNGYAELGLVTVKHAVMPTLIHEIGHAWMFWPHSYAELPWKPVANASYQRPNFYSNRHDVMSELTPARPAGWHQDMPATLAINRYAAGWIDPEEVALHLTDEATYTLAKPLQSGNQFLVINSGRPGAFTTLEVLDERNAVYRDAYDVVYAPASPGGKRPLRYEGVMVSRYDQTNGTGINARTGPALYNSDNPAYESDVGYGQDDYSVIADGESRSIGGGLTVSVAKNSNGSYDVTVSGGKIADYIPWCIPIWFSAEYDTGCALDAFNFGN